MCGDFNRYVSCLRWDIHQFRRVLCDEGMTQCRLVCYAGTCWNDLLWTAHVRLIKFWSGGVRWEGLIRCVGCVCVLDDVTKLTDLGFFIVLVFSNSYLQPFWIRVEILSREGRLFSLRRVDLIIVAPFMWCTLRRENNMYRWSRMRVLWPFSMVVSLGLAVLTSLILRLRPSTTPCGVDPTGGFFHLSVATLERGLLSEVPSIRQVPTSFTRLTLGCVTWYLSPR